MEPALRFIGLDHVVLRVRDLQRMLDFYGGVLGCPVERRLDDLGLVQLRAGAALIDLVPVASELGRAGGAGPAPDPAAGGRNLDHFCLQVRPFDEAAIRAHLARHGLSAGPTERRYGAEGMGPSIYLLDPEGNTVELKGPPDAALRVAGGATSDGEAADASALRWVTTTVALRDDADRLAKAWLEQGLAACVQSHEVRSHFRWQGQLHENSEWRLQAKTTAARLPALLQALRAGHPYELPEVVVGAALMPNAAGCEGPAAYAHWVAAEVAGAVSPAGGTEAATTVSDAGRGDVGTTALS
jgi:glyoxylase I family protein